MSETIAEMVVPGTYIEVRSEGLIGTGAIATGNIGVVGTAARGEPNRVRALGSYTDALDLFGSYDAYAGDGRTPPLGLVRTLEQVFIGGGSNVYAARISNGTPGTAKVGVKAATGAANVFTLTAVDAGSWGNAIAYTVAQDDDESPFKLTLTAPRAKETYVGKDAAELAAQVGAGSKLVTVSGSPAAGTAPKIEAGELAGGTDGANVTSNEVAAGLAALAGKPVNIVLVAGVGADVARAPLQAHLEQTTGEGRERIGIVGARSSDPDDVAKDAGANDGRLVVVAPGLRVTDTNGAKVSLPPSYTAALVAGKLATLAPQISLTNKTLPVEELDDDAWTSTDYAQLLQSQVLLVRQKFGFQIVKGITSDTGAFKQISVRRIVDYAKAGVRSGADAYIGRLNNVRVRAALKATLDGFLSQMVLDEMLVAYALDVTATREQEINGICAVSMTLLPTFSIDYIRVTINLQ